MKTRLILQSERAECGLACIAMLASAHGLEIDLPGLRARHFVSTKGTTLKDLIGVARVLQLETRALRCEIDELDQIRLPAMLHWRLDHFVVLVARRGKRYIINDPAIGRVTVSAEEMNRSFTGVALEAWPSPTFARRDMRRKLRLGAVIPRTGGLVQSIFILFLFAFGLQFISLSLPILQQFVIDDALVSADRDLLTVIAVAMSLMLLGKAATVAIRALVQRNLSASLSVIVPSHIFRHMADLPTAWFEQRFAADIMNRVESGNTIHHTLTSSVITVGIDSIVAVVAIVVMLLYSPILTAIVVATFLVYGAVRALWYNMLREQSLGAIVQAAKVQSVLLETMRGIATLKLFNAVNLRHERYLAFLSRSVRLQNKITTSNVGFTFAHDMVTGIETVLVLVIGAGAVMRGELTIGMLVAFFSFRDHFINSATSLINVVVEFRMLGIHLDRLADILLTAREETQPLPYLGAPAVDGRVELRGVSFRYGAHEADVLKDCSLVVEPGQCLAIIGPSGAGKSTLLKLLSGQLRPTEGQVLIDGEPVTAIGLTRLRDLIGVVRQDDVLFSGTIAENIAMFDTSPDHERIRAVAAEARLLGEIERMPMGFNTLVGDMGTGLSGGQLQRLMLARALYKTPRILLLDEATSHLDLANEQSITANLRKVGITQVIVAHRPETIAKADRVVDIREINKAASANFAPLAVA
ncbi:peptidase domain-containing ABC transporter [Chelatococcus sp. GCM10030263]|uniref:peptidase domain-containing ABC transporter n=1 Tax=Chelatococcus sp. GCM10030263 TaxID=3273387 RepID=UPI003618AE1D